MARKSALVKDKSRISGDQMKTVAAQIIEGYGNSTYAQRLLYKQNKLSGCEMVAEKIARHYIHGLVPERELKGIPGNP